MAASLLKALTVLIVLQLVIIVAVLIIDIVIFKNQNNAADTTTIANATTVFSITTTESNNTTITSTIDTNTSSLSSKPAIVSLGSSTESVPLSAIDTTTTTTTTTTIIATTCTITLSSNSMIDCYDWRFKNCATSSGIYVINPRGGLRSISVYCDMTTDGGGWTVIQSLEFWNNTWQQYKDGFNNGFENGNLWLGNDRIHVMSQSNVTLRVEINGDRNSNNPNIYPNIYLYGKYNFSISDEINNYTLQISPIIEGNASDSNPTNGFHYNNGMPFSTVDKSSSQYNSDCTNHCELGGWWFDRGCTYVALNGKYNPSPRNYGFAWHSQATGYIFPDRSEMKIRRI